MHELGITQGIVDHAREAAVANGATKVTVVHVLMTPAADFTEDALHMYFEMLTQDDDLLRGAELRVRHEPARAACVDCGHEFKAYEHLPTCVGCGSINVRFDPEAPMIQLTDLEIEAG